MLVLLLLVANFFQISYSETSFYDNYALKFPNGSHDASVFLRDVPFQNGTHEISISMWFKEEFENDWSTLIDYTLSDYEDFWIGKFEELIEWSTRESSSYLWYYNCLNQWAHFTLTCKRNGANPDSGDIVQFFINGVRIIRLEETFRSIKIHGNGVLSIGQDQSYPGELASAKTSFHGEITSVNIWDRVLSDDDVILAYQSEIEGNIVSWSTANWVLDGDVKKVPTTVGRKPNCENPSECNVNQCDAFV